MTKTRKSKPKRRYPEFMQNLVMKYRESGEPWPASRKTMARWMIRNNLWDRCAESAVEVCARDIARAMREEFHTDDQHRRVRTKHAAKFKRTYKDGSVEYETLWGDIRTEPRKFMERAFAQRRKQIVGDCVQL